MNVKLPLIAVFAAALALTACGGGGGGSTAAVSSPTSLTTTDTLVGTGLVATTGDTVKVNYSGYLYDSTATGFKGKLFDSSLNTGRTPLEFKIGTGAVIAGFDQGVTGMKVGGKRTVLIPSSLGYGSAGTTGIPGGSGLVFDLELISVGVTVSSPSALSVTDTVVGTGNAVVAGNTVTVQYTGYLYNASVGDFKGSVFDTTIGKSAYTFKLGSGTVIPGFDQGITGMKVGGKRTILIPSALGYGANGTAGIPGGSGLVFDVQLVTAQ
jgi:peptidylprolyl isomerase